jgi:SAM-dependent methyltransferase
MTPHSQRQLEDMFATEEYVRQRICPRPGDQAYLHLSDLLLAIKGVATSEAFTILDYGAGASPYRSLFQNSEYHRADVSAVGELEYLINDNGTVPAKSNGFDVVLSTQVLEHVNKHETYLSECFRLLKPGGMLVLTTHGLFEDHGCPYDFQRWTADGLKRDLRNAGFEVIRVDKLTSGPRAIMFLIERYVDTMNAPTKTVPRLLHWVGRTIVQRSRRWIHVLMDRYCSGYRNVSSEIGEIFYIALFAYVRRPR